MPAVGATATTRYADRTVERSHSSPHAPAEEVARATCASWQQHDPRLQLDPNAAAVVAAGTTDICTTAKASRRARHRFGEAFRDETTHRCGALAADDAAETAGERQRSAVGDTGDHWMPTGNPVAVRPTGAAVTGGRRS
jgi:hypothetical protein